MSRKKEFRELKVNKRKCKRPLKEKERERTCKLEMVRVDESGEMRESE